MWSVHINFFLSYRNAVSTRIFLARIKWAHVLLRSSKQRGFRNATISLQCLKLCHFARLLLFYSRTVGSHTCVAALGKGRHRRWESAKRYQQDKKTQNCELVNESKLYWSWYITFCGRVFTESYIIQILAVANNLEKLKNM